MKMYELVKAGEVFRKIKAQEIDIRTAYELAKLIKKLDVHLKFYDEKRMQIIDRYYKREDEKLVPKSPEDFEKTREAMAELLILDVELDDFKKITIPADEKISLSAADIMAIENFIEIKFEEE